MRCLQVSKFAGVTVAVVEAASCERETAALAQVETLVERSQCCRFIFLCSFFGTALPGSRVVVGVDNCFHI